MSGQPQHGYFGISEVLAPLRADFPDISVSKIRFLETEGLLTPARSPSGYRRVCAARAGPRRVSPTPPSDTLHPRRNTLVRTSTVGSDPRPPRARPPRPGRRRTPA